MSKNRQMRVHSHFLGYDSKNKAICKGCDDTFTDPGNNKAILEKGLCLECQKTMESIASEVKQKEVTKITIDNCEECKRVFTDTDNVEAIEATGLCLECIWLQEGMSEENNDGEKRQTAQL